MRASEGLREGPSAGKGFWGGAVSGARAMSWSVVGALGRVESGIEFGRASPVSEVADSCVRGAETPRSVRDSACEGFHTVAEMPADL